MTPEMNRERAINLLNEFGLPLDEERITMIGDFLTIWIGWELRHVQQPATWMPQSIPSPPSPKTEARIANLTPGEILQGEVWINGAFLCRLDDFIRITVQGEP